MFEMLFVTEKPMPIASEEKEFHGIRSEDAKIDYLYHRTLTNSDTKAQLDFMEELTHRLRVDHEFTSFDRQFKLGEIDLDTVEFNFDCIRDLIQHYKSHCAAFDEYVMTHTHSFVKACSKDTPVDVIKKTLDEACAH